MKTKSTLVLIFASIMSFAQVQLPNTSNANVNSENLIVGNTIAPNDQDSKVEINIRQNNSYPLIKGLEISTTIPNYLDPFTTYTIHPIFNVVEYHQPMGGSLTASNIFNVMPGGETNINVLPAHNATGKLNVGGTIQTLSSLDRKLELNPGTLQLGWRAATNSNIPNSQNLRFAYLGDANFSAKSLMTLTPEGKIGVGTESPATWFHIYNPYPEHNNTEPGDETDVFGLYIQNTGGGDKEYIFMTESNVGKTFTIANNGNVFIGENLDRQNNGDYKLFVEKGIRAESVRVDVAADNGWADYVFEEDYELMSAEELRAFITKHKHLPNVPSEEEVLENGIDLAEMNAILLRQVEELTLRNLEIENRLKTIEEKLNK